MSEKSDAAWSAFDELVSASSEASPWVGKGDERRFDADFELLAHLLAVPIGLGLNSQSGIPAKALDVWIAAQLRRAGFGADEVWPRATRPRVLSTDVSDAIRALPDDVSSRIDRDLAAGRLSIGSADAKVLGKAYEKQVDVVISRWSRGVELMVSTKRMDSSFGKNLLNRVEESYGDAKNLRARHPLAAIGFFFALRATALAEEPAAVEKLIDLLMKLEQEEDGYDAVGLVITDWSNDGATVDVVNVLPESVPSCLQAGRFLERMIRAVLDRTPVDYHVRARELWRGETLLVEEATDA